jgi:hypothetical protein
MLAILDFFSLRQVAASREGENQSVKAAAIGPDQRQVKAGEGQANTQMRKALLFQ